MLKDKMTFLIVRITILSLIFIILFHHLLQYCIDVFTIPKIKDYPNQAYREIYNILQSQQSLQQQNLHHQNKNNELTIDMKHELKDFIKQMTNGN